MNKLTLELNDSHSGVLVRVELDEGESSVGLHPDLNDVTVALDWKTKKDERRALARDEFRNQQKRTWKRGMRSAWVV